MKKTLNVKSFLANNLVAVIFLILTVVSIPLSGFSAPYIINEILSRIGRNAFLVFSLILPIMAGMGINFGMVLGAMAGQIGLIFAMDWQLAGIEGIVFAALIGLPISVFLGWIAGSILNRARGREMVTSYILGFFFNGIYQFVVLYLFGSVIPMHNKAISLSRGYGVRNTLNLEPVRQVLDNSLMITVGGIKIPMLAYLIIGVLCVFIVWFKKTKLGQDMRAVGQDQIVSNTAGIPVEKTRILAIVISTVLACFGQIIFLQNMGNMNTYNAHDQTGFFAAAAILVGGATVSKATIPNCFAGVLLLHLMYIVVPRAGQNVFGDGNIGEYFRQFIGYGVIALSLVIHAWRTKRNAERARQVLSRGASADGAAGSDHAAESAGAEA
ncbi:ABC transporter permease subunit [Treponema brennaborense]|uniref:ABC-type transporter, integral membrane subunit n=1 Tax=Treponema brennaborense (strain DSM 12168 / CIP 105900 / DD5/3) TaxID=906968 RepID=F4LN01_TREBD|nr:ABC transporter [Treponema brennaborense]AEE15787.1 ABC-type transporter, integral membrane subunit [Treponema brennaborense DSM 12168]